MDSLIEFLLFALMFELCLDVVWAIAIISRPNDPTSCSGCMVAWLAVLTTLTAFHIIIILLLLPR